MLTATGRVVAVLALAGVSTVAQAQAATGLRCSIDALNAAQAQARVEWARRCALTNNVGNPAAYFLSTKAFDTSYQWAKEYREADPSTNPSGVRTYSGSTESWNVNYYHAWALYERSPVYTVTQETSGPTAGYYKWSSSSPRTYPLYPIFGTSVDSGSGIQLFPHPSFADCRLYSRQDGLGPVVDFYVSAYCESGTTTRLVNGIAEVGQSGAQGEMKYYTLWVPQGVSQITFETLGGAGNANLYVRPGALPTLTTYACRSAASGNSEVCTLNNPASGIIYVMLHGSTSFSGVSVIGRFCGNGVCERGEDSTYCASDCFCGDGVCSASESAYSCADDCGYCGDGICLWESGETSITCPWDCGGGTCGCFSSVAQCPQVVVCPMVE